MNLYLRKVTWRLFSLASSKRYVDGLIGAIDRRKRILILTNAEADILPFIEPCLLEMEIVCPPTPWAFLPSSQLGKLKPGLTGFLVKEYQFHFLHLTFYLQNPSSLPTPVASLSDAFFIEHFTSFSL